ncbi:MAG: TadE/TadG family type IV pilus assembly protein, partial [Quisquiliibacterium sp.]
MTRRTGPGHATGVAAIETLLAAPVVLLLGLAALQWGLVFHAHQALSHAAHQGARAGSL